MKKLLAVCLLTLTTTSTLAGKPKTVDEVMQLQNAPEGVVFDVDEWDHDALQWAVPVIRKDAHRLRQRFPGIKLAMVTHGEEEFALMKRGREVYPKVHEGVKQLISEDVKVHVCAGHVLMNGQSETGFVDFVDSVPAGADKVAQYMRQGYIYIEVLRPDI